MKEQPWIRSARFDLVWIFLPAVLSVGWVIFFYSNHPQSSTLPPWGWALLIVGVDVAHVYSTLFRTYLDQEEFGRRKLLYLTAPLLALSLSIAAYGWSAGTFWRLLAYFAVFHFIRQQYGFLRIYSRRETQVPAWERWIDAAAIYMATIYPLIYWHAHLPRAFNWFVEGDFIPSKFAAWIVGPAFVAWGTSLLAFGLKEWSRVIRGSGINLPRILLVGTTALSWYVGIIGYNGDLGFTAINVVSHGIPYMAMVWEVRSARKDSAMSPVAFSSVQEPRFPVQGHGFSAIAIYLGVLVMLAFLEEGLWDGLIWREHASVFRGFSRLPQIRSSSVLTFVVPLLSLPQATHYLLDGFIWKKKAGGPEWKA